MYTIQEAKETIKNSIEIYLQKDEAGTYLVDETVRLPFYLEGAPGIGKTEIVKQIAEEMGLGYVSFSLTHHTRNSLLGLPVIKDLEHGKYTEYTMSEIIASVMREKEAGHEEGILLLDEFSCVSDSILPAMLAFLQTKNIGMYTLPEGWVIVLCGNPPEYNRGAKRFDAAILDRIRMVKVEFDAEVFLAYAADHDVHPDILSYLKVKPHQVYRCLNEGKKQQLVTCRGWMNVSHAIKGMEKLNKPVNENLIGQFLKSTEVAHDFYGYYNMNRVGICERDIKAVLSGRDIENYIRKYKDKDMNIWWHAVDLFADFLTDNNRDFAEDLEIWKYGKKLGEQLADSANIMDMVEERLHGGIGIMPSAMIPMWNCHNPDYQVCTEMERSLLDQWKRDMNSVWGSFDSEENDREWEKSIEKWNRECLAQMKKTVSKLSRQISHVFTFLRGKDVMLADKFYQVINHSEMLLTAMTMTKNKDYLCICKENYAV